MNDDSSISERIAQRDARVARARERLRRARTEQERADAVCEELDAKIECDRAMWSRALGPTPAIAAMVMRGRLSIEEAVRIEQANCDAEASVLAREIESFVSARDWLAFEALVPTSPWNREQLVERFCAERDLDSALALLDAEPLYDGASVEDGASIEPVARAFGRDSVARYRARARDAIASLIESGADPWQIGERIALLSHALTEDEQRRAVLDLSENLAAPPGQQVLGWSAQRTLVTVANALLAAGEVASAEPWIERAMLTAEFEPPRVSVRYTHAPLLARLRATVSPEEHARWEQRVRAFFGRLGVNRPSDRDIFDSVGPLWREEIQRKARREFDVVERFDGPLSALTVEQQRAFLQREIASMDKSDSAHAVIERLRADPALERELLQWTPRRSRSPFRPGPHPPLLCLLLDAASDGNRAAIELVRSWRAPREVVEVTEFFRGLAPEIIDELVARAGLLPSTPRAIVEAGRSALTQASDEALARWREQHNVHVDRAASESARADLRRAAERWIEGEHAGVPTKELIERARELPGGEERIAREGRERVEQARASRWQNIDELDSIEAALVYSYDLETLVMLVDREWSDWQSEVAYRTIVRCAAWQRARGEENATLRALSAQVIERFREWRYEDWQDSILAAFGGVANTTFEEALRMRPYALVPGSRTTVHDCVQLGITDEVLALCEGIDEERSRVEAMCGLLPFASESARERALTVVRATFRSTPYVPATEALLAWVTVEDVVERWSTLVGANTGGMLDGPLLEKLGGVALVDRVGDAVVKLFADGGAHTIK